MSILFLNIFTLLAFTQSWLKWFQSFIVLCEKKNFLLSNLQNGLIYAALCPIIRFTLNGGRTRIDTLRQLPTTHVFNRVATRQCQQKQARQVQLTMEPETLTDVVDYIPTGQTVEKMKSFVKACDVLKLDTFKMASDLFMFNQIGPDRLFQILQNCCLPANR